MIPIYNNRNCSFIDSIFNFIKYC